MRVSARCDYACKALLELALQWPNKEPVHISVISEKQGIPMKYLVHILIQLKRMGFVESVRGRDGGYILTRPPSSIKLGEVMQEVGGQFLPLGNSARNKDSAFAVIWKEAEAAMADILNGVTFEDIAEKTRAGEKAVIYQI